MKKLVANVKDREGNTEILRQEYSTKKAFKEDIRLNGYTLTYSYIFTEEEYNKFLNDDKEFMAWFEARINNRNRKSRIKREVEKMVKEIEKEVKEEATMEKTEMERLIERREDILHDMKSIEFFLNDAKEDKEPTAGTVQNIKSLQADLDYLDKEYSAVVWRIEEIKMEEREATALPEAVMIEWDITKKKMLEETKALIKKSRRLFELTRKGFKDYRLSTYVIRLSEEVVDWELELKEVSTKKKEFFEDMYHRAVEQYNRVAHNYIKGM